MTNSATAQGAQFSYNTSRIDAKTATLNESVDIQQIANFVEKGYHKYAPQQYEAIQSLAPQWYEQGDQRAKGNLDLLKKGLAWTQPTGYNRYGHAAKGLQPNGYAQIDIDFHHKGGNIEAAILKERIKAAKPDFIGLCAVSPTLYGLKIFAKTNIKPSEMTPEVYKFAQKEIIKHLSKEFSINPDYFDEFGIAQACYMPFDPSLYFNPNATGFEVDLTRRPTPTKRSITFR